MSRKTVSFLVSGRGSNFSAVAEKIISGEIKARPGILISNRPDAPAIEKAESLGIKAFVLETGNYPSKEAYDSEMAGLLEKHNTDLIVTAGYMRILSSHFVKKFRNRIINIHPALLPSFPGVNAQKQALEYGVKITGCTTHFIDEGTDTGPIIMQAAVPVLQEDTLNSISKKILKEEHRILQESVRLFCENRLKVINRTVIIS